MEIPHRFLFRGAAVGVAGHIRRPRDMVLPAQASISLSTIGGRAESRAVGACLGGIVSFGVANAFAQGDYTDSQQAAAFTEGRHDENRLPTLTKVGIMVSDAAIHVEDREVSHTVKVSKVGAVLTSRHPEWNNPPDEPDISCTAELAGLSVDGVPVEIEIARWAESLGTFAKLQSAYKKDPELFEGYGIAFFRSRRSTGSSQPAPISRVPPSMALCTIVKAKWPDDTKYPPGEIEGNRIRIPDFGSIFLGELLVTRNERRLTMMRFAMGSLYGGELAIAETDSNGNTFPP